MTRWDGMSTGSAVAKGRLDDGRPPPRGAWGTGRQSWFLLVVMGLAGCAVGPDFKPPAAPAVSIVQNDVDAQSVTHGALGIRAVNFWSVGKTVNGIASDAVASVLVPLEVGQYRSSEGILALPPDFTPTEVAVEVVQDGAVQTSQQAAVAF